MELRDLIVTPIIIFLVYVVAYLVRAKVTNSVNRKYFIPALTAKILGALALGFIYQFYYEGGDTFNYHTLGSRHIWEAFMDSPMKGIKLLSGDKSQIGIYKYASQIIFYNDSNSYFVVRIAGLFDLITFSSYSGTATLFSLWSFAGSWAMFITFYRRYTHLHFYIAICILFIPSVIFWGSGILKDTLVLGSLGLATYCVDFIFNQWRWSWIVLVVLIVSIYIILSVKLFILQAFMPAVIFWVGYKKIMSSQSIMGRFIFFPLMAIVVVFLGYWTIIKVGESDNRYALDNIAMTAKITAYDIGFYTGRDSGSGYSLGDQDGTMIGMLLKAPRAVNVSLFRPYLWEVKNPLMLLSALEGSILLLLVLYIIASSGIRIFSLLDNPDIVFLLAFSIIIAFAVGVTSYNFGTLSRYKIPMMPYFTLSVVLLYFKNSERKFALLDRIEK